MPKAKNWTETAKPFNQKSWIFQQSKRNLTNLPKVENETEESKSLSNVQCLLGFNLQILSKGHLKTEKYLPEEWRNDKIGIRIHVLTDHNTHELVIGLQIWREEMC